MNSNYGTKSSKVQKRDQKQAIRNDYLSVIVTQDEERKREENEMKMTGRVGTVPYIAPELFADLNYSSR